MTATDTPDLTTPAGAADVKPLFLKIPDVARALGCSRATVYELCATRKLRHVRVGSAIKISAAHVAEYLERNTVPPLPPDAAA